MVRKYVYSMYLSCGCSERERCGVATGSTRFRFGEVPMASEFRDCEQALRDLLGLAVRPIAISFMDRVPADVARFEGARPPPTLDGRTGAVPAGCVFWIEAGDRVFATLAEDHGNCSVGLLTHGFRSFGEVARNADVAALCESGWVTLEAVAR